MKLPQSRLRACAAGLLLIAASFWITGCSSTKARINKNQDYFNSLALEKQAQIRAGSVAIGFNTTDAYLALGAPDAKYTRTTEQGESVIWAYRQGPPPRRSHFHDPWPWHHGYHRSHRYYRHDPFYSPWYYQSPYYARYTDDLRLVFDNGIITAIERAQH